MANTVVPTASKAIDAIAVYVENSGMEGDGDGLGVGEGVVGEGEFVGEGEGERVGRTSVESGLP